MIDGMNLIGVNLVDDGDASQRIGISRNRKLLLQQPLTAPLRDLNLEALDDLPFMVKQRKIRRTWTRWTRRTWTRRGIPKCSPVSQQGT